MLAQLNATQPYHEVLSSNKIFRARFMHIGLYKPCTSRCCQSLSIPVGLPMGTHYKTTHYHVTKVETRLVLVPNNKKCMTFPGYQL